MTRNKPAAPGKPSDPAALLLATGLSAEEVARLLGRYGFADLKRADENIQAMAGEPRSRKLLARILGELLEAVGRTADPDQALNYWERFLATGINRGQLFEYLHGSLRMLHLLCTIFGNSPAMAQTLVRDPLLIYWLAEAQVLTRRPTKDAMEQALGTVLINVTALELKLDALRRFRRREMLRIGIRDLLRLADVPETTETLSHLGAVLIQGAYEIVEAELRRRYGRPMHRTENRLLQTGFAVIALGKLGGGELNFSSDVDLIYVYGSDEGRTTGASGADKVSSISNEEYFEYLARDLTKALADVTQEGHVFRVDLRLRAEGSVGRLARSLEAYVQYYQTRGQNWERLALLKASPIAGDPGLGQTFLQAVRPFALGVKNGERDMTAILEEVRSVKEMIDEKMAERGHERRNVKLGTGGIRELEFVVQAIQVLCGNRLPGIVHRSTLASLSRFQVHELLPGPEHDELAKAYLFLRDVEHKLQMVHDLQTHALPDTEEELTRCAIRLGYGAGNRAAARKKFAADYHRHTGIVNRVFRSLFYTPSKSPLFKAALAKTQRPGRK